MIELGEWSEAYKIRWLSGKWKDKAGHIWKEVHKGTSLSFVSDKHGEVTSQHWHIKEDLRNG